MTDLPPPLAYPDAEEAVLGALLLDPGTLATVRPLLPDPSHFTEPRHVAAYRAILALSDRHQPIDHITLAAACPGLDAHDWIDAAVTTANLPAHAAMLADATQRRATVALADRLRVRCHDRDLPLTDTLAGLVKAVADLHRDGPKKPPTLTQVLANLVEGLGQPLANGATRGVPSGLRGLDNLLDGFGPGLHILAGNASEGKSALATFIARRVAETGPVWINSLEMNQEEIAGRLLQAEMRKTVKWLTESPERLDHYIGEVTDAAGRLALLPITIAEGLTTPSALRLAWQAECAQGRAPRLIIIDYLQLMKPDVRQGNRTLDLAEITGPLKQWSLKERLPILVLSQLNRDSKRGTLDPMTGERKARKPQLHDLRDSGSIEQDADSVTFLYWPQPDTGQGPQSVDLLVMKNRSGPKGTVPTRFSPWIYTFEDLTP
jgi:replicative DNA helicase